MQYFPPALENLVEQFARLPGVGVKSAQRLAFHVLSLPEEDAAAFAQAKDCKGVPTMLLAKTVKGKGVSFMENQAGWHGKAPNAEQYEQARQELVAALAEKEGK